MLVCLLQFCYLFRGGPVTLVICFLRSTEGRRSLDSSGATGEGVTSISSTGTP